MARACTATHLMGSLQSSAVSCRHTTRYGKRCTIAMPEDRKQQGRRQTLGSVLRGRTWQDREGLCSCASDGLLAIHCAQQQRRHQAVQVALQLGASRTEGCRQRMQAGRCHLGVRLACSTELKLSQVLAITQCPPPRAPLYSL